METVRITVIEKKSGEEKVGDVMLPTTLNEAASILNEKKLLNFARTTLIARARRHLASGAKPRNKLLHIRVNEISEEQKRHLIAAGLLKSE